MSPGRLSEVVSAILGGSVRLFDAQIHIALLQRAPFNNSYSARQTLRNTERALLGVRKEVHTCKILENLNVSVSNYNVVAYILYNLRFNHCLMAYILL